MQNRRTIHISKTEYRIRKCLMLFTYYSIRIIAALVALIVLGCINFLAAKLLQFIIYL